MSVKIEKNGTYDQVLKSTSIMGGAAGVNMLLGLLRVKTAAVLIGTVGVGLIANFTIISGLLGTIAGLGLQSSAVRDIVAAHATTDQQAVARTISITLRICFITGLIGLLAMAIFSKQLSIWTFGNSNYHLHITCLGLVILWGNIASGYQAIIQGVRRIDYLALGSMVTGIVSTIVTISLYFMLGSEGIVPSILVTSFVGVCVSWLLVRKLDLPRVRVSWRESVGEAGGMIRLGSALMTASVSILLGRYVTNALLTNQISLEAIGIYSAAFALSAILVTFVLDALNADYYPRLIAASENKAAMGELIAEQVEVGLLMVTPGLLFTLSFAPLIVELLYSREFLPAVELLQWFVIASMASVLSRPAGFVLVALGKSTLFLLVTIGLQAS